jgi:hypothetical protein
MLLDLDLKMHPDPDESRLLLEPNRTRYHRFVDSVFVFFEHLDFECFDLLFRGIAPNKL